MDGDYHYSESPSRNCQVLSGLVLQRRLGKLSGGMVRREFSLRKMFKAFEVCLELACVHYGDRRPPKKWGHPWVYPWSLYLAQKRNLLEAVAYNLWVFLIPFLPWIIRAPPAPRSIR